jgi:type I restriction enzyme M protein
LAAKVINNSDFGYYKVTIERPARLKAQFTQERIAELRFDRTLKEPMEWAYETFGEKVYTDLKSIEKELLEWCEKNDLEMNSKKRKDLTSAANWIKQKELLQTATQLMAAIGTDEHSDYNLFLELVDNELKTSKLKLAASEKNQILAAVSWYHETAEKVIRSTQKLNGEKLTQLLHHLDCTVQQLPDFGYYPTGKKDEYIIYETQSDLRDSETVPLQESIHTYFLREVKPHVAEAWIDLDKTKIGYEISFNKYFYQHKPLRSIEEVTSEILQLEKENEGLIMEILKNV